MEKQHFSAIQYFFSAWHCICLVRGCLAFAGKCIQILSLQSAFYCFIISTERSAFISSVIFFCDVMMIAFSFKILIEIKLSQLNNVELEIKSKTSKA